MAMRWAQWVSHWKPTNHNLQLFGEAMQVTCSCGKIYNIGEGVTQFRCVKCKMFHTVRQETFPKIIKHHKTIESAEVVADVRWPWWALAIWCLRAGTDRGVGDTVHRILGPVGAWYMRLRAGKCGCADRQLRWNLRYRY